ncbi:MAG: hypothetical protein RBS39_04460 [Phycisphaerales bacterium]|jgi:hypothetical protein|nr:hypothetical protein [Phycisphaerales bacterium]
MPPLPRFRNAAVADIAAELRFAPKAAILRAVESAELLAGQVDASAAYPIDFVVFRLTGYRPDAAPDVILTGADLLADLGVLAEHLSHRANLTEADLSDASLGIDDLTRRWNVSRKTVERLRRQGLVGVRVRGERGRERTAFRVPAVEAFERAHAEALSGARAFTRLSHEQEHAIFEEARALREAHGWSLHGCARTLATTHGRGVETMRALLRRLDPERLVFPEPGPPDERLAGVFERALRRGIEPREIGERYGHPRRSVLRAAHITRITLLRDALRADGITQNATQVAAHTEPQADALRAALEAPSVRDATRPERPIALADLLAFMRERVVPVGIEERQRLLAISLLVAQANSILAAQSRAATPSPSALDTAETALRRASLLGALALRPHLRLILDTLEQGLARPLDEVRPAPLSDLLRRALRAAGAATLAIDPRHGGRLAAPVGLAAQRVVAAEGRAAHEPGRARARLPSDAPGFDWTHSLHAWQGILEPPQPVAAAILAMDDPDAHLLAARLGLERLAEARAELAQKGGTTPARLAARERRVLRAAWLGRGHDDPAPPPPSDARPVRFR